MKNILAFTILFFSFSLYSLSPSNVFLQKHSLESVLETLEISKENHSFSQIKLILEAEEELSDNYYVLYHSQTKMSLYHDLIKILLELKENQTYEDFIFLRLNDAEEFNLDRVSDFFRILTQNHQPLDDEMKSQRKFLLSVNPSLFSNFQNPNCSTLHFWLKSARSFPPPNSNNLLLEVFNYFGIDHKYYGELSEIYSLLKEQDSQLIQIFIPKVKYEPIIEKVLYFSHDRGVPCTHIRNNVKSVLKFFEGETNRLPHYETLQARLFINDEHLLNPNSGIIMKCYDAYPVDNYKDQYQKKLKDWALKRASFLLH